MTNAIYLRISFDPQNLGLGVERQRVDCEALAATRFPDTPTRTYIDNDKSAYSGARRPAYEQMLIDVRAGTITRIIAYNLDRLTRQPRQLEQLIDLGIPIVTAAGDLDLTTHDGQLQGRILAAVAKKSSDDTSRRVKRARQDAQESGRWAGGRISYPYISRANIITFRSVRARDTTRAAVEMFLTGHSIRHIARECGALDASAPQTDRGWRWVLLSPALAGLNTHGIRGQWEAIITPVEHAELLAILRDPSRNTHPGSQSRSYWLSGLVTCAKCHRSMYPANETRTGTPVIRCQTCGMVIRRAHLDATVSKMLWLAAPLSPAQPVSNPSDPPGQPTDAQSRLPELAAMYVRGDITRVEWDAARAIAPQPARPVSRQGPSLPDDLQAAWPELEEHRRHEIARGYLHRIEIHPAPRNGGKFAEERVRPRWRE